MIIDTKLGPQKIEKDKLITFPRGLIGFESLQEFTLLQISENSPLLVLQSTEDPAIGLLVTDPYSFMEEYPVAFSDYEQQILQSKKAEELAILVTVSIPPGQPEKTSLNLLGPILINHAIRMGVQVPQTGRSGPDKFFLNQEKTENKASAVAKNKKGKAVHKIKKIKLKNI